MKWAIERNQRRRSFPPPKAGTKAGIRKVSKALDIRFYSGHATIGPFLENKWKWAEPANCLVMRSGAGNISSKNAPAGGR